MSEREVRIERDSLGEVEVAHERYWGSQTERAIANFDLRQAPFPRVFLRAYALVKQAAAKVNAELAGLAPELARAIESAADEVAEGRLDAELPLGPYQSGSGTQTNMNLNEVIASRANEILTGQRGGRSPVHPNDHVNLGQSTNDSFPTAMHVATALAVREELLPELHRLADVFDDRARRWAEMVKIGRTHLQDATPLSLGQEISGWAHHLHAGRRALTDALRPVYALAIGGTAVGTGLNAAPSFGPRVIEVLAERTGVPFVPAPNRFAALAGHDALLGVSGALRQLAAGAMKIANDVRLLASGPRSGLGELEIPANEPGSSIMPGKVNPTQAEMLDMVAARVIGNDVTVGLAGSQGNLELNTYKPVLIAVVLESVHLLTDGLRSFRIRCAEGLRPREARIREHLGRSLMLVTALTPHVGYDRAAEAAKKAHDEDLSLEEAVIALGLMDRERFRAIVRPERMIESSGSER